MEPTQEIINNVKQLHSLSWISPELKSTLEKDFPELKENEDERIRKALIRFFKHTHNWVNLKYDGDEIVAHLERQKDEVQKQFNLGVQAGREEVLYELEKQKPAEWSEKDEKILNEIITIMDGGKVTSGTYLSEYVAWLKSLRPQPHWKPSEEQMAVLKNAIESILEICNSCDIKRQFSAKAMDFWAGVKVKCEDALQTRQSLNELHWKPSKYQMKALDSLVFDGGITYVSQLSYLKSLYNDLKKL